MVHILVNKMSHNKLTQDRTSRDLCKHVVPMDYSHLVLHTLKREPDYKNRC